MNLKEQCDECSASSSQGGIISCFDARPFLLLPKRPVKSKFSNRPNFLPDVDKAKLLVRVDTFSHARVPALILASPKPHILQPSRIIGVCGGLEIGMENKEGE